jgi:pantoate--beta-alanine ligase
VFAPPVEEIYLPGFDTTVSVGAVAGPLEGAARPGHFDGVATVVAILFDLVGADRAYFGQKDAQQVMVIRQMARDLAIRTEVIACPTVREPDGLALSSRNVHLAPDERAAAPVLRRALLSARARWDAGERSADRLREAMRETLAGEPLATPDYVSVADGLTLAELDRVDRPALLSLAVRFGETRLIDNEVLADA